MRIAFKNCLNIENRKFYIIYLMNKLPDLDHMSDAELKEKKKEVSERESNLQDQIKEINNDSDEDVPAPTVQITAHPKEENRVEINTNGKPKPEDIFVPATKPKKEKKPISDKQKEHLEKIRNKALKAKELKRLEKEGEITKEQKVSEIEELKEQLRQERMNANYEMGQLVRKQVEDALKQHSAERDKQRELEFQKRLYEEKIARLNEQEAKRSQLQNLIRPNSKGKNANIF